MFICHDQVLNYDRPVRFLVVRTCCMGIFTRNKNDKGLFSEQFDPASPCRFEIVDLIFGVRCGSALDLPSHGCELSNSSVI